MKSIKVVRPLKSSQQLREEASQPMLAQAKAEWKPLAKSGWGALPEPAKLPGPEPKPEPPVAPVAYSAPDEVPASTPTRQKYVTGSRLAATKMPLPKGVYVVIALTVINLVLSLFRVAETGVLFATILFFDLMTSVGLLLQLEFFRKLLVLLSAIIVVLAGVALSSQNHATKLTYVGLIITAAVSVAQAVYVTRPKVCAAFETLKT